MVTRKEFARRRKRLMEAMEGEGIAIIPGAPIRQRNRDIEFPYRQDSDFYYLTGFSEPEAVAVLIPGREQGEYLLFCRERDSQRELWDGPRAGLDGACERYDADDAFPIGDIDDILPGLMENRERLFYAMGCYPEFDQRVLGWLTRLRGRSRAAHGAPSEFVGVDHILHEMRLYKSKAEIRTMRKAAEITIAAHKRVMSACRPGVTEFELEAEFLHECMLGGSRSTAYPTIVASGANGCVLHYVENADTLKDGELLLIDAGAEYGLYACDITRTYPINGRFSTEQRIIYEIVLEAQRAAIEEVRPGNHWNDPHEAAVRVIAEGLLEAGILRGEIDAVLEKEGYKPFYMHRTGHWLGMDVHDVGDYKVDGAWRVLEPGMVTTVEPGIYIKGGSKKVPKRWWNIGVRIEDDVLVTANGPEVLTDGVPKTVADVEAFVGSG